MCDMLFVQNEVATDISAGNQTSGNVYHVFVNLHVKAMLSIHNELLYAVYIQFSATKKKTCNILFSTKYNTLLAIK